MSRDEAIERAISMSPQRVGVGRLCLADLTGRTVPIDIEPVIRFVGFVPRPSQVGQVRNPWGRKGKPRH